MTRIVSPADSLQFNTTPQEVNITQADLWQTFHASNVDTFELCSMLLRHYRSAGLVSDREVYYPSAEGYALKLVYREEMLESIEPGPALTAEAVDSIKAQVEAVLLSRAGSRVRRTIFFSDLPVKGWWRYKDRFQILPPPTGAPTPEAVFRDQPFTLESCFADVPDSEFRVIRGMTDAAEIGMLLTVLLEGFVWCPDNAARKHWVYRPLKADCKLQSEYAQEGYAAPAFSADAVEFTPPTGIPPLTEVSHDSYYGFRRPGGGQTLEIPSSLARSLDHFYAWSDQDRKKYLRACYWFRHAQVVSGYSASASFLALINAVEALMPQLSKGESTCPECKKSKGPGPTRRFVEFLEKHAPGTGSAARSRRLLYEIRSAISHRGRLLWTDSCRWYAGLHPLFERQIERAEEAWQTCRVALVNYIDSSPEGSHHVSSGSPSGT